MWPLLWVMLATTPLHAYPSEDNESSAGVVGAIEGLARVLASHESHAGLYERVALLEATLTHRAENEARLEVELEQLRARVPLLEAEIETIPKLRKDLADFEAKISKLVHEYEAKLSTLASEVIRLKKDGARMKDLQTLSDQSDSVMLRPEGPPCPEVGHGMFAERVGGQCLYFSWGSALNWTSAHRQCQSLGGDLAVPQDLVPLKAFLHRAFARGPSIWLGATYDFDDESNTTRPSTSTTVRAGTTSEAPIRLAESLSADEPGIQHDRGRFENFLREEVTTPGHLRTPEPRTTSQARRVSSVVDLVLLPEDRLVTPPMDTSEIHANRGGLGDISMLMAGPGVARDERAVVGGNYVSPGAHLPPRGLDDIPRRPGMKCMLLQQQPGTEYEAVGSPCNELHRFACEIVSFEETLDKKFVLDNLVHE